MQLERLGDVTEVRAQKLEPHGQPFRFPVRASIGKVFPCLADVQHFLDRQSVHQNRHVRYSFTENKVERTLTIQCCQCTSFMVFQQLPSKQWQLKDMNVQHLAATRIPRIIQCDAVIHHLQKLLANSTDLNSPIVKQDVLSKFDLNEKEFEEIRSVFVDLNQNNYVELKKSLERRGYRVERSNSFQKSRCYPDAFVLLSKGMAEKFGRYGRCLYFKIVKTRFVDSSKIGSGYRMGMFYVKDSALRIGMVGCVVFQGKQPDHLLMAMELFFQFQNPRHVECLVTDNSQELVGVVAQLIHSKVIRAHHLFDPYPAAARLQKEQQDNWRKLVKCIRSCVETTNFQTYEKQFDRLKSIPQSPHLTQFLQNANKYCFVRLPKLFCGVWRFFGQGQNIHKLAKKLNKKGVTVADKLEMFIKLDASLDQEREQEQTQVVLAAEYEDSRIMRLSAMLEHPIMEIFLKSYIRSRKWTAFPSPDGFELVNIENQHHLVADLKCDCDYTAKTGIPCEHTINCATVLPDFDYSGLFSPRWLLQSQKLSVVDLTD